MSATLDQFNASFILKKKGSLLANALALTSINLFHWTGYLQWNKFLQIF